MQALLDAGHNVHALARARPHDFPIQARFSPWLASKSEPPGESLTQADAVIHLAGEPVAQRWTPEGKQRIRASRVDGTRHLVNALSTESRRPQVLINASAVGIYGSRGDEVLTESSPPGDGFLAQVTLDWEESALLAEPLGIRVVLLRTGMVLGHGGALARMLPPFRMGVGGRLASGQQWISWIHIDDAVRLILFAVTRPEVRGPINVTAPNPVTNKEFTRQLAAAMHRPAIFPVPKMALRILFGEMADVVLASQRVMPRVAQGLGFQFQHAQLDSALRDLL